MTAGGDNIHREQLFSCVKRHDTLHQSQVPVDYLNFSVAIEFRINKGDDKSRRV